MTSYYPDLKRYCRVSAFPYLKYKILPAFLLPAFLLLISCTEKATIIGTDLLPGSDFVSMKSTNTMTGTAFNLYIDSVNTTSATNLYLGGIYDPYFGNTTCDFVSQLRLTQAWPGGDPTVDSVKLFLSISSAKGDLTYSQALQVYEIGEQLNTDSATAYYSNRDPGAINLIGTFPLDAITKDTIQTFGIVMPKTFGQYLLSDTTRLNQESGTTDFRSFFKGIYITTVPYTGPGPIVKGVKTTNPNLMTISTTTNIFYIRAYYHTASATSQFFDFIISDKCARYNRYKHDFSMADPAKKIQHVNDSIMDTVTCIQSFNGIYTRVKLPDLSQFKDSMPLSVNRAKLVFSVLFDGDVFKSETMPTNIYMAYTTSAGVKALVPDYYISTSFYDGTFNTTTLEYTFNIAQFAQEYLKGKIPSPVVDLYLPQGEYKNVILKSFSSKAPPKFTFIYSRF